uniref:Uncharacterized protein n=1 Tax=Anguilla anguilla TaxID=7936 RepID=A0A0E9W9A7_ANGAN
MIPSKQPWLLGSSGAGSPVFIDIQKFVLSASSANLASKKCISAVHELWLVLHGYLV